MPQYANCFPLDSTPIHHPTFPLRSSRASFQSLLLAILLNSQHHRRTALPSHRWHHRLRRRILPDHWDPKFRPTRSSPSLHNTIFPIQQHICPYDRSRSPQRRDGRCPCHSLSIDELDLLWCIPDTNRAPGLLDFHVPVIALHILDRRYRGHAAARPRCRLLHYRDVHLRPSPRRNLPVVYGIVLEYHRSRLSTEQGRHLGVPVLQPSKRRPVPSAERHLLGRQVAEFWSCLGLHRIQCFCYGHYVLHLPRGPVEEEVGKKPHT